MGVVAYKNKFYAGSINEDAKADITSIGTNETGNTASKAYAVGEHFYKNGKFCTCKQAISQGGTFTLDTNYKEDTVSDALVIKAFQSNLTFSAGGNVDTGINLKRPIFGAYTRDTYGAKSVYLIPYASSSSGNWCLHAYTDSGVVASTTLTNVTIHYGALLPY